MFLEEWREMREKLEAMGKNAPRTKARPLNSHLVETGETCKTCVHRVTGEVGNATVSKCGLNEARWTHSINTDIRQRDPACNLWEKEKDDDTEK